MAAGTSAFSLSLSAPHSSLCPLPHSVRLSIRQQVGLIVVLRHIKTGRCVQLCTHFLPFF